jgi:hypothetical protein
MPTLFDFARDELTMTLNASDRYGEYFELAAEASINFSNLVHINTVGIEVFLRFHTQAKKHHTLSLLSTVRQHRVQAKQCLRVFVESIAHMAYALEHKDEALYFDRSKDMPEAQAKVSNRAYKWLKQNYADASKALKEVKDEINAQTAHANLATSVNNFSVRNRSLHMPFFDLDDDDRVKVDLWQCAKVALVATDLIMTVRETSGGFIPQEVVRDRHPVLAQTCDALLSKLIATTRFKAAADALNE